MNETIKLLNNDFLTHLDKIDEIIQQAGGINDLFFEFARPHLDFLAGYLGISQTGTLLLSGLVNIYDGSRITIRDLTGFFKCNLFYIFANMNELEILEQKEFIHIYRGNEDFSGWQNDKISFELRYKVIDALCKGCCPEPFSAENLSIDDFFEQLEHLFMERVQKRQSYKNCKENMNKLLQGNKHLVFVQKIKKLTLSDDDTMVLLRFFIIWLIMMIRKWIMMI
jgi:hypothetical protein